MENRIEYYWKVLQKKLSEEQIFCLFIIMIFTGFQRKRYGIEGRERFGQMFTQDVFYRAALGIQKYDIKEAALRLSEKVDWMLMEEDEEVRKTVQEIFDVIYCSQSPDILLEAVLELSGRTGGYIATPQSVRYLTAALFRGIGSEMIADFCCGTAVFGVGICRSISGRKTEEMPQVALYGAEKDSALCVVGRIMMELYGIPGKIEQKDILMPPKEAEATLYDLILLDMPRGSNKREVYDAGDPRIAGFKQKTVYADWILIQDVLFHLKDEGYAAVLCTTGTLIRANERALRQQVVRKDWLEAVITLPANLYPNTRTGTELLIFHKGKKKKQQNKILFVDISQYYFRERRNAYAISEEGHRTVCACFRNYEEMDGISIIRSNHTLDAQTCSWKPIQYIQQGKKLAKGESVDLAEIAEIVRGAQVVKKDIKEKELENRSKEAYFINIKDIQKGAVIYETAEKISDRNSACKDKYRIREDDILITSKGTAIKMAIVGHDPPPAFISGNITLMRVKKEAYDPYVLFHYLDSWQGRFLLEQIQSGTTIRILNNTNLSTLKVPLYDAGRMREIGSQLKAKREIFFRKQKSLIKTYEAEQKILMDLLKEER